MHQSNFLIWILVIIFIVNTAYSLIPLFMPLKLAEKGVSRQQTGLVFGMYALAIVVVSPLIGRVIGKIGHANLIALGIANMGLALLAYSLIDRIESTKLIFAGSLVFRIIQGASSSCVQTSIYSIATNMHPQN